MAWQIARPHTPTEALNVIADLYIQALIVQRLNQLKRIVPQDWTGLPSNKKVKRVGHDRYAAILTSEFDLPDDEQDAGNTRRIEQTR